MGPRLVENLEGSAYAKQRLEVILETITGQLPVTAACEHLGIGEAMFHRLRQRVLQAGLAGLEPRRAGRPPRNTSEAERARQQLQSQVESLQEELDVAEVRRELATILSGHQQERKRDGEAAPKKTTHRRRGAPKRRARKR